MQIGLPLKNTYTTDKIDPGILEKLGKENETSPTYNFLGLKWNLLQNTILRNSYFGLAKKKGGIGSQKMVELEEAELYSSLGLLSHFTAECYQRLGICMLSRIKLID